MGGRASPDAEDEPPGISSDRSGEAGRRLARTQVDWNRSFAVECLASLHCSHLAARPLRMLLKECAIDPGEHND